MPNVKCSNESELEVQQKRALFGTMFDDWQEPLLTVVRIDLSEFRAVFIADPESAATERSGGVLTARGTHLSHTCVTQSNREKHTCLMMLVLPME